MMNIVNLMGRLTKDPVIRVTTGEKQMAIANFTLAVQDNYNNEKANFITCKAFGKTAEIVEKYCHKGDFIGLTGHINTGSYEKDGAKVYTTDVVVDEITFTPKYVKNEEVKEDTPDPSPDDWEKLGDDDIPF